MPAMDPAFVALASSRVSDERAVLEAFLDFNRCAVVRKVRDLPDPAGRQRLVPSATTLAGLVKHLTQVETNWFCRVLARELPPLPADLDPVTSFAVADDERLADLVDGYEAACARSRAAAARFALDDTVPQAELGTVSLRWIYVHLIEETARHAGHADILRELTDGATGLLDPAATAPTSSTAPTSPTGPAGAGPRVTGG